MNTDGNELQRLVHEIHKFHKTRHYCPSFKLTHLWMDNYMCCTHDDVIKWKHFPRYWPFVWGIHRSPVNSPYKGQWRGALMFSLFCPRINDWVNNGEAGDLRRYRVHYDVIVMHPKCCTQCVFCCGLTPVDFTRSLQDYFLRSPQCQQSSLHR